MAAVFLAACATSQPGAGGPAQAAPAAPAESAAEPVIVDDFEGDGMDLPLDGTSLAAFEASLERVGRHSDPSRYQDLLNAIEYLLVYDLAVKGDKAKLAGKLDSRTGYEVVAMVKNRTKGREKGPAGTVDT